MCDAFGVVYFRSVTVVVSKMDSLMHDELMELKDDEISKESFNQALALQKHKFHTELNTRIKDMLPDKKLPKIGNS